MFSRLRFRGPSQLSTQTNYASLLNLSWVSFFWSSASMMIFSLLPTFLCEVLGASKTTLGLIEGSAVFLAFVAKICAGILSDYWRRRKPLIMIGSFFNILVKILFATAAGIWGIFIARSLDRLCKGIRAAPTDALIADLAPKQQQGKSYGMRYTLYTLGAVAGGVIAAIGIKLTAGNYQLIFMLSTIPASFALLLLWRGVTDSTESIIHHRRRSWHWRQIYELPPTFWQLLVVSSLLMLARFSEAFLTLQAKHLGWSLTALPILMIGYDLVNAAAALPIGKLADVINRKKLLLVGIMVLLIVDLVVVNCQNSWGILAGITLAGLHMGMSQGLIATLIAENTPPDLRGTAFAIYYLSSGVAVFVGNAIAGFLADFYGSLVYAFKGGVLFSSLSALVLVFLIMRDKQTSSAN